MLGGTSSSELPQRVRQVVEPLFRCGPREVAGPAPRTRPRSLGTRAGLRRSWPTAGRGRPRRARRGRTADGRSPPPRRCRASRRGSPWCSPANRGPRRGRRVAGRHVRPHGGPQPRYEAHVVGDRPEFLRVERRHPRILGDDDGGGRVGQPHRERRLARGDLAAQHVEDGDTAGRRVEHRDWLPRSSPAPICQGAFSIRYRLAATYYKLRRRPSPRNPAL